MRFNKMSTFLIVGLLIVWAIFQIYPLFWMILQSLRTDAEIIKSPFLLPTSINLTNFKDAWLGGEKSNVFLKQYFFNSLIITSIASVITLITSVLAGYALARFDFIGRKFITSFIVSLLAIPGHVLVIPLFKFMLNLGLLNSYIGLSLIYTTLSLPFSIIILIAFFKSFLKDLIEAAKIDGCSEISAFFKIVLPLSSSAISAVMVINFISYWNEYLFALVLNPSLKTITVGVAAYKGEYNTELSILFAGLTIATIPILVFYLIFQKRIIKGMTLGAVKG